MTVGTSFFRNVIAIQGGWRQSLFGRTVQRHQQQPFRWMFMVTAATATTVATIAIGVRTNRDYNINKNNETSCSSSSSISSSSDGTSHHYPSMDTIQSIKSNDNDNSNIRTAGGSSKKIVETDDSVTPMIINTVVIPTIQSLQRISRLMGTCLLITMEYKMMLPIQLFVLQQQQQQQQMRSSSTKNGDEDGVHHDTDGSSVVTQQQREYWEEKVNQYQKELDDAQAAYSSSTKKQTSTTTIEERVFAKRLEKQQMMQAAQELTRAQEELSQILTTTTTTTTTATATTTTIRNQVHLRCAQRLLKLCQQNRGVYIKIGQHLANLDYLLPPEYVQTLSALYDQNPITSYDDVLAVIAEDFHGQRPCPDLFDTFDPIPIASASLAQVHVAHDRQGNKYAVKVQHRGLRETSLGDIISLNVAVQCAEYLFPNDFTMGWIAQEIAPNLPNELNFIQEGHNAERASEYMKATSPQLSCVIPKVHWEKTSSRVLTMDFEEGCKVTDIEQIQEMGLDQNQIATLVSSIFASQVFLTGFVHCDPHPANVLLRKDASTGKPIIVLVDHGLYKSIDVNFRIHYAQLWKSLLIADIDGIMQACYDLGMPNDTNNINNSNDACRLFAAVITARPFDEVIERSHENQQKRQQQSSLSFLSSIVFTMLQQRFFRPQNANAETPPTATSVVLTDFKSDQAIIRGYAQRFLPNIVALLSILPRQVLLLLKMNDCLRHIEYTLQSTTGGGSTRPVSNTMIVNGQYAAYAIYQDELKQLQQPAKISLSVWKRRFYAWWSYLKITTRIHINDILMGWIQRIAY